MKICKINWRHLTRLLLPAAFATALMTPMAPKAGAAVIIDFDHLTGTGLVDRGFTYTEDGFVLDNLSAVMFRSVHSDSPFFAGTVSFNNNAEGGVTRLTRSGGGAFDLATIDLDSANLGGLATEAIFNGTLADSSIVTQSFTTDAIAPGCKPSALGRRSIMSCGSNGSKSATSIRLTI